VDAERAKELLERERERLEGLLAGLRAPANGDELSDVDQHLGDTASELTQQETDAGLAADLEEQLAAIERAEKRLQDGTFGTSIESGEPIPDGRLERIPWAERTAEEQSRFERGG
jgi:DnaK suppressor protein